MQDPVLFTVSVLIILGTPGPTNTLLATAGASSGFRDSLQFVIAEGAGYLISILAIGTLLEPILASSPVLTGAAQIIVGLYLFHVAWRLLRNQVSTFQRRAEVRPRDVFVTTLLNPKASVFATSIIPFGQPTTLLYLAAFLAQTAVVATAWIAFGATMGKTANTKGYESIIPRIGGTVLAGFATMLVATPFL